tara:strand:- start:59 stop:241 length:183 start_codon:yes stop_codon:yes gene_type:complete
MSAISELDAVVEEYNAAVARHKAELQPLAVKIQELQGQIINDAREADKATTEDGGEACPA